MVWWLGDQSDQIGPAALEALETDDAQVAVSVASIWEAAIKRRLGKLVGSQGLVPALERGGVPLLAISPRHADHVAELPDHHRDPFDRLLVAQAQLEGMALVSGDKVMGRYDVEVIW